MLFFQLISNPIEAIFFLLILVFVISIHEYAHARTAHELGDPTPEASGRLTLDPRAHLDPLGSFAFLFFGFGWGKPVPIDPYNLRNPKKDYALISLAGPSSNFISAIIASIALYTIYFFANKTIFLLLLPLFSMFIRLNLILGVFNLLPFFPLDGFSIVGGLLNREKALEWEELKRYGMLFLFLFIMPFAGGKSMLEIFVSPLLSFLYALLIPG